MIQMKTCKLAYSLNFAIIGNRGVAHILINQVNLDNMDSGTIAEVDIM